MRHIRPPDTNDFMFCHQQLIDFSNSLTVTPEQLGGFFPLKWVFLSLLIIPGRLHLPRYTNATISKMRVISLYSGFDLAQSNLSTKPIHTRCPCKYVVFSCKWVFLFYLKWRLAVVILDLLVGSPEQQHSCTALLKTAQE